MGGTCSTYGGDEKYYKIEVKKLKQGDNFGDIATDEKITLKSILQK